MCAPQQKTVQIFGDIPHMKCSKPNISLEENYVLLILSSFVRVTRGKLNKGSDATE